MKLALIPPVGYENFALQSYTQMALAFDPAMANPIRTATLRKASERGDWVMLDNGANEGAVATAKQIKNYGELIGADEIVLPDVLDSHARTVKAVKKFVDSEDTVWQKFTSRMAVVQGTNMASVLTCVNEYVSMPAVNTIGIPRRIIDNFSMLSARIDVARKIEELFPGRFEIHLLGAYPSWPQEVRHAVKYAKIRSMDTSLPFNFAIAGKKIDDKGPGVSRPTGFFTVTKSIDSHVLQYNISKVMEWANATQASSL